MKLFYLDSLQKFILKRIIIFIALIIIIDFLFLKGNTKFIAGLIVSSIFGFMKFNSYSIVLKGLSELKDTKNVFLISFVRFVAGQGAIILLMALSIKYDIYFFYGVLGGVMIIPLIIFINSITEGTGITKNMFQ